MDLALQEVLIVGNNSDQVKFSELTLDMFRILQTLEREPSQQDDAFHNHHGHQPPQPYGLPSRAPSLVSTHRQSFHFNAEIGNGTVLWSLRVLLLYHPLILKHKLY